MHSTTKYRTISSQFKKGKTTLFYTSYHHIIIDSKFPLMREVSKLKIKKQAELKVQKTTDLEWTRSLLGYWAKER